MYKFSIFDIAHLASTKINDWDKKVRDIEEKRIFRVNYYASLRKGIKQYLNEEQDIDAIKSDIASNPPPVKQSMKDSAIKWNQSAFNHFVNYHMNSKLSDISFNEERAVANIGGIELSFTPFIKATKKNKTYLISILASEKDEDEIKIAHAIMANAISQSFEDFDESNFILLDLRNEPGKEYKTKNITNNLKKVLKTNKMLKRLFKDSEVIF